MIPRETVAAILDATRIEDVIGDFVTLKRRGANYTACCPFHNEKTPSFSVSASKGIFKCFGCGKAGNAVTFVMEHENMSYVEALRYLAGKYHIEVVEKEETAEEIAAKQHGESLLLVSEFAGRFFQESLKSGDGRAIGYSYFKSRGLEDATIEKYGLGWAPVSRNALTDAARKAGYKEEYLIETGLSIKYEDGRLKDRFYDRVMFPIHSVSGRVIAFGGRTLKTDKSVAKYINSPETEIYVKNKSLYGIYFAKNEIARMDRCILVEGYLDVLSMHQLGIRNVVASSGTSLTTGQIALIRKFTDNVTIIYDGDSAGIHAALRGIDMVLKDGMNVKIVLLPDGDDPDSFSRKHTLDEVQGFIAENEQDFIEFKTDMLLGEASGDPLKRAQVINEIADTIAVIPDAIVRASYIKACAGKFEMEESLLAKRTADTRSRMLLDEKKQRDRAREMAAREASGQQGTVRDRNTQATAPGYNAQATAGPVGESYGPDYVPEYVPDYSLDAGPEVGTDAGQYADIVSGIPMPEDGVQITEPLLEPAENELLSFLLNHGLDFLEQGTGADEKCTVAEFIDVSLNTNDMHFVNPSNAKTYEAYFKYYDEGLNQEQITNRLFSGDQPADVVEVAKNVMLEKYQITVKNFEDSLTTTASWLQIFLPKALTAYFAKRYELKINGLRLKLKTTPDLDAQLEIADEMEELTATLNALNKALGRAYTKKK